MKLVLAGPPRSGKSCLRAGLKEAIKAIPEAAYPFVITACPDGEGAWFHEAAANDPAIAAQCKAAYKSVFTPAFVERIATSVRQCSLPLVLIDIGGIPSVENERICADATHILILSSDPLAFRIWRSFASRVSLQVFAEIDSRYHADADATPVICGDGIARGSIHHLERGEPVDQRSTIQWLAHHLVELTTSERRPIC